MAQIDIFITEKDTGSSWQVPWIPEKISFRSATKFASYSILDLGEVKVPNGQELSEFKWESILPGKGSSDSPFIHGDWEDPKNIQSMFSLWRSRGTELKLLITGTPVNHDVFLVDYEMEYSGGYGDYTYAVAFTDSKNIKVKTISKASSNNNPSTKPITRPTAPTPSTHTVKSGDTLWAISLKYLGSGSRYKEIFNANRNILKDPNKIKPGQVLKIPKK